MTSPAEDHFMFNLKKIEYNNGFVLVALLLVLKVKTCIIL